VRFDGRIASGQLPLISIEELEVLLQDEHVFGPVIARQCGNDFSESSLFVVEIR
jgi:hypothetical protein